MRLHYLTVLQTKWRSLLAGFPYFWVARRNPDAELVGQYYRRTGSCNQCAQCCQAIYLTFGREVITSLDQLETIRQAHPEYQSFEPIEHTDTGILFQCNNLQADGNCGIYESRPGFCRSYPNEDMLLGGGKLPAECSYRFELLKRFDEVLQKTAQSS